MDRLQAVADVRQRARHDHAHRVVEVARPASRPRCGSARMSPRSSVTWSGLLTIVRQVVVMRAAARASAGRAARRRTGRRSRRRAEVGGRAGAAADARRGARGSRVARRRDRASSRASRMTQARWPSSGRAAMARPRSSRNAVDGRRGRRGHRAEGPGEGLLDVRLGVADQLADQAEAVRRDARLAAAAAVDERHRRDRGADEAALPARRRVDELLELRPAVRLGEDALADGVGEGCRP